MRIPVRRLDPSLPLPRYARASDAGLDLHAAAPVEIAPGARALVATGLALAIPAGYAGLVLPRSGLALRHGVTVLNAPGTIDEDYRGEVQVLLVNLSREPYTIAPGDRIAQLVVAPVVRVRVEQVADADALGATQRGTGGFGSSGR